MSEPVASLALNDVREGGEWTRAQRLKNALLRTCIRALLWTADRLPARLLIGLLGALGAALYWCAPGLRRRAERNLSQAGLSLSLARPCFANAGKNLGRSLLLRRSGAVRVDIDADSRSCFAEASRKGQGIVFISLHLGPFEWLAARVAELCTEVAAPAPAIVVRESYDPGLDPLVDEHRVKRGLLVIHRGKAGAAARIVRALKQGRAVGFLPDLGGRVRSAVVPWFGQQHALPVGPQRIAARTGAALLLGYLQPSPEPGRYQLRITNLESAPAEPARRPQESYRAEQFAPGTREQEQFQDLQVASAMENAIRSAPEQWLWMAPRL